MSFTTAISGLNASTADLNTIGNNVANAGTTGFKLSRAQFTDVYPVSAFGTSSTTIGSGVRLASVAQQFSQGNVTFTSNNLDLAINGQGFFRMNDGGSTVYSRSGAFGVDRQDYVSNSNGQRLTGYLADSNGNITGQVGDMQISKADIAPRATTNMTLGINLNASAAVAVGPFNPANAATYNNTTSTSVYDSLGGSHTATMYYRKTAANTWETHSFVDGAQVDGPDTMVFTSAGALSTINGVGVPPPTITTPAFVPAGGGAAMTLTLDYANATQYGSAFGVNSLTQDGYTTGRLTSIDIDDSGVVFARYTNSQSRPIGQVVLTNFANPQGLRPLGDTSWAETFESGTALTGVPGTASLGLIQSGALEDSNVNLTEQLVSLITAQRNFQANAQVISTEDAITQTIINIR